ncbi:MAG: hypothetical protein Q4A00_08110 [Flavobacteriaceae bacterium]|nr:hypothetical protein [Flavobacteriaceae bacterium]
MVERQNNYSQNLDKKETKTNKEAGIKYNKEKDKILSDTKKLLEEEKNIISRLEVEGYEYYYNNPKIRKLTQQILDIYDKKHK